MPLLIALSNPVEWNKLLAIAPLGGGCYARNFVLDVRARVIEYDWLLPHGIERID